MAENTEKIAHDAHPDLIDSTRTPSGEEAGTLSTRKAWMYRSFRIEGIRIPFYASPPSQLLLVALVCFLCPGMFNAINGLGGGGQVSAKDNNDANVALYSTFSVVGFFAGSIANRVGIKFTLSFGGLGYCIYASSLLCYNHTKNSGFLIFAGALLGVCAGLLWTAQGAIMMSYPPEGSKGRYISWFWIIFNLGSVIGSLIPLGQTLHSTSNSVNDGTYIGFIVLMFVGAVLAWTLVDSRHVERHDGSHVILMKHPTWKSEILGLLETLRYDSYIIALFPMFFASNWFYTYQFNDVNLAKFNIRTRALNSTLYWTSQIFGACIFGYALDFPSVRRSVRARAALGALFIITMAIWGGGYAWQRQYTRAEVTVKTYIKLDWTSSGYVGPMFLYMFYGFYDAAWQTCIYWYPSPFPHFPSPTSPSIKMPPQSHSHSIPRFMGALTNNSRRAANFAGFYKGIQSAGAAIIYRIDALNKPYMAIFGSSWGLLAASLLIAAPVVLLRVRDHVSAEEDLRFSDETLEEVVAVVTEEGMGEKDGRGG
ncbi:MAG: hypothetical protein M1827_001796 [Pycnora praestabilis]|nr:MAG: hypothetical protein M1827_001796 [Pycnora praestabilis]